MPSPLRRWTGSSPEQPPGRRQTPAGSSHVHSEGRSCCISLVVGAAGTERYSYEVAIAIAAVAFAELGFSTHGFFSSRRRQDMLIEAVKLGNLASSLILLVLTQTALLSMTAATDSSVYNGICGILMGLGATAIGVRMLRTTYPARLA